VFDNKISVPVIDLETAFSVIIYHCTKVIIHWIIDEVVSQSKLKIVAHCEAILNFHAFIFSQVGFFLTRKSPRVLLSLTI
jgi:hypothetical protein